MKSLKYTLTLLVAALLLAACSHKQRDLTYAGTLDGTKIQVSALTGGKILELLADEGDLVQKGDTIAIIDTEDLHYQQQQLEAANAALASNLIIAQSNMEQAERDLKYLRERFTRTGELYKTQAVSQQTYDDMSNQLSKMQTAYSNSKHNLTALQNNLKQNGAQISGIQKKIRDATILAPNTGTITTRYFSTGEVIPPMGSVAEIIDTRLLDLKIYVSVDLLGKLKLGDQIKVKPEGMDDIYSGNIIWISQQSEFTPKNILTPETRSSLVYAVKIQVPNTDGKLKHGMPVEAVIAAKE